MSRRGMMRHPGTSRPERHTERYLFDRAAMVGRASGRSRNARWGVRGARRLVIWEEDDVRTRSAPNGGASWQGDKSAPR
jgi:hypothetical protein